MCGKRVPERSAGAGKRENNTLMWMSEINIGRTQREIGEIWQ